MQESQLYGRLLLQKQVSMELMSELKDRIIWQQAIDGDYCQRCQIRIKRQWQLPNGTYYCGACLQLGRITSQDKLITLPEPNDFTEMGPWQWTGQLTKLQQLVADEIISHNNNHLVWAVTGAGKTEILFPVIAAALANEARICIAAPRIDVILELAPRFRKAFPEVDLVVLYGQSTETYRYTQLVLCTTHQLLKFRSAFDVLIIDEIDAFPFANNPVLKQAPRLACKPTGRQIWLTATPTITQLLKAPHKSYLPKRFHGYPLPVIKVTVDTHWRRTIKQNKLSLALRKYLQEHQHDHQQCLIFVPTIDDINPVVAAIKVINPMIKVDGVSAQNENRIALVKAMRNCELQYLITTTILERGVTFPDIDVIILGADHLNYTSRSLIQIAGRVGRKASRPTGMVLALVEKVNWQVLQAQWTIRWLNQQAKQRGRNDDL